MQNTKNLILSLLLIVLLPSFASAQQAGTFHVFPMVTAGVLADGSGWDAVFFVTNVDGRFTTCGVELIGMPDTDLDGTGPFLASLGSLLSVSTEAGRDPPGVEVGYMIVTCDHAVSAWFVQGFDPGEATGEVATTHPAARSSSASIPLPMGDPSVGAAVVAIVNDEDVDADFDVTVFDILDGFVGTTRVNIPAKTQLVEDITALIPDLLLLPVPEEGFLGSIKISSVENRPNQGRRPPRSVPRFYALGMFMEGTVFAFFPATQLAP